MRFVDCFQQLIEKLHMLFINAADEPATFIDIRTHPFKVAVSLVALLLYKPQVDLFIY
jgi:hypothetical protein